ncbi:unnamed protein product [Urochloa humidicola]
MWVLVKYGGVTRHEDRRALEALVAAVPPELGLSLSPSKLRQEWDRLAFQLGEDVDDFVLRLSNLVQRLKQFGDKDIIEDRAVEKLLRAVPLKYKQIALAVHTMLDLSTMTIEEATGRLKAVNDQDEEAPGGAINIGGRLYYTKESWLALQKEQKNGEATGSVSSHPHGSCNRNNKVPRPRDGSSSEGECEEDKDKDDTYHKCVKTSHWARNCKKGRGGAQAHLTMMGVEEEPTLF